MTQEQEAAREAEETAVETEEQSEVATEVSDEQTTEEVTTSDEDSKQYEAILEREKKAREEAEKAAADLAFKLRNKKRKDEVEEVEEQDEDKPLTARQLQELLTKEREATRKEMQAADAERIASKMSTNETEKKAILLLYENRSFPASFSVEEKIEECYILANKQRILGENNELKRALRGKSGASNDASTTHHDAQPSNKPRMAAGEEAVMAQVGFKWNATKHRYEKKLPDGSTLIKDPKSKQTQRILA